MQVVFLNYTSRVVEGEAEEEGDINIHLKLIHIFVRQKLATLQSNYSPIKDK